MTMVSEAPATSQANDKELVHLIHSSDIPPPGGGLCRCIRCGLHFQSKSNTWTTSRLKHDTNSFTGAFTACKTSDD